MEKFTDLQKVQRITETLDTLGRHFTMVSVSDEGRVHEEHHYSVILHWRGYSVDLKLWFIFRENVAVNFFMSSWDEREGLRPVTTTNLLENIIQQLVDTQQNIHNMCKVSF